jgi:hypothetical protein
MFEKICELKEVISENTEATLGKAVLKILYDEDVYGARIIALKLNEANGEVNEDEIYLCNHLIAIQTNVDVNEAEKCCTWSGLDFSVDPPRYRKFVAIFSADSDGDDAQVNFLFAKKATKIWQIFKFVRHCTGNVGSAKTMQEGGRIDPKLRKVVIGWVTCSGPNQD